MADVAELIAAHIRDIPDFPRPGVCFRDITPLLADAAAFRTVVDAVVAGAGEFDVVAGIEARGFIVAAAVAIAAGVGLVPIRKAGKLPFATVSAGYRLEYGSARIEMHTDAVAPGQRVLLVDDVLATGGTLAAALDLMAQVAAHVVGVTALIELTALDGRGKLAGHRVHTLVSY